MQKCLAIVRCLPDNRKKELKHAITKNKIWKIYSNDSSQQNITYVQMSINKNDEILISNEKKWRRSTRQRRGWRQERRRKKKKINRGRNAIKGKEERSNTRYQQRMKILQGNNVFQIFGHQGRLGPFEQTEMAHATT